jgi:micrococcal nuclease
MTLRFPSRPGLLLVALLAACSTPATGQAADPDKVWVNLRSGIYHCPGSGPYGKSRHGTYLPESTALARGYKPRGGVQCVVEADSVPADGPLPPAAFDGECLVERISDGDTLRCRGHEAAVRLIGIDAPERDQPGAAAATAGLARLAPVGTRLHLEFDKEPTDRNGRRLAYLWRDGRQLNWALVRRGFAVSYRFPPNLRHAIALDSAEARARAEQAGLWATGSFECRPVDHRRRRC